MSTSTEHVAPLETHYAPEQLAEAWGVSLDFVRKLFRNEPGVVVFCNPRPGRRVYRTIRVPASVAERVRTRMMVSGQDHTARMRSSSRSRRELTKCA
jgi:hypothetical protein